VGKSRVPGGYIDVPRYLYDAILAAPGLSGAQLKVVLVIVRLTWGFYPEKHRDGIIEQLAPPTGRRAATIRVNPDPRKWGRFEPVEYAVPGTLAVYLAAKTVEYAAERTLSTPTSVPRVRQPAYSTGTPVLLSSVLPSLEDFTGCAEAPVPSREQERPRCFHLPGYGEVYEHDTWAAEQPDSRALYLATFGVPSNNGGE
jgi:hypothetical protein